MLISFSTSPSILMVKDSKSIFVGISGRCQRTKKSSFEVIPLANTDRGDSKSGGLSQ